MNLARRPLAVSMAAGLALAVLSFAWVVPFYSSYDDPAMSMIVSGTGFATAPDEHLVFSNVALGRLLRDLYTRYAAVPWYGLHLLGLQLLAAIGLLYASLRVAPTRRTVLLFVVYFCVAALDFLTRVQFTSTAYVAAVSGLLLAVSLAVSPPGGRKASLAVGGAAVLMMVAAGLVRFEALALAALLTVPVAGVVTRGLAWKAVAPLVAVLATAALATLGLRAYDRGYYERDERWRDFRAFNDALRPFVDYDEARRYSPRTADAFRAVGWSRTDHRLLLQWFHPDDGVFTSAKLRAVRAAHPTSPGDPLRRLWRHLPQVAGDRAAWPLVLVLPLFVVLRAGDPRARGALLAAGLSAAAALVWLVMYRKTPPHVYLPVLSFPAAVGVCVAGRPVRGRVAPWLAGALALAVAVASVGFARSASLRAAAYRRAALRSLGALQSPPRLIVGWAIVFPFDAIAPLDPPATLGRMRLFTTGWPQRTPVARRMLATAGARDALEALAWRPDVVLVAPHWVLPALTRYARRHRGWDLRFVAEPTTSALPVFRVSQASRIDPPTGARDAMDDGL